MRVILLLFCFLCLEPVVNAQSQPMYLSYPQIIFDSDTCCWRKLSAEKEYTKAAALAENYLQNSKNITNKHALTWHTGQLFAMAGDSQKAIRYFKNTYSVFYKWFGGEDGKAWYYYAKGSVAFLEKDVKTLDHIILTWKRKLPADKNLHVLISLSKNRDKPYKDAY